MIVVQAPSRMRSPSTSGTGVCAVIGSLPSPTEVPLVESRSTTSHPPSGREHPVHEGHQQQARRQDGHTHGGRQLLLVLHEEAAVGRDGPHALALELARAVHEGRQESGRATPDDEIGGRARDTVVPHGERERGGVAHVTRDAGKAGVEHQDADREPVLVEAAPYPARRGHPRCPNSPPRVLGSQSVTGAGVRDPAGRAPSGADRDRALKNRPGARSDR